jgi:hypothetical protein
VLMEVCDKHTSEVQQTSRRSVAEQEFRAQIYINLNKSVFHTFALQLNSLRQQPYYVFGRFVIHIWTRRPDILTEPLLWVS